jgi:outer membrane protein assembly factor BamB
MGSLVGLSPLLAQEWTRFRGPNGTGLGQADALPTVWSREDFNWKTELPGAGHSSPAIWGEKVFATAGDEKARKISVVCVHAAGGQILWQKSFPFEPFSKHNYNTFASGSPAVDKDRVYVTFSDPHRYSAVCLDHEGNTVWEKDLGPFQSQHGCGASPIVFENSLIVPNEQDGESCLYALEAGTGKVLWKTPRQAAEVSYSTPFLYDWNGKPALIFQSHGHGISAIDPGSGKVLWELNSVFDKRTVGSPILAGGLIVAACGSGGGGNYVAAVSPANDRPAQAPRVAWTVRKSAPYVPTSICVSNRLYFWSDGGIVSNVDPRTGQVNWQERVGGNYFGSPVYAGGRIFGVSTRGEVVVVEASDQFKILARNALDETVHSTPAIGGGRMFIHTLKHLVSIGGRKVSTIPQP